jgi:hypothetical protein
MFQRRVATFLIVDRVTIGLKAAGGAYMFRENEGSQGNRGREFLHF